MPEQTPVPSTDMKQCPYCGKMTSTKANFCWWCTRELTARPERPESSTAASPRHIPRWAWIALAVALVAGGIIFFAVR
jgi:hypothetical protein